jgi:SpoVK/Ycf46/Vps4 family AAA+-type ATPase
MTCQEGASLDILLFLLPTVRRDAVRALLSRLDSTGKTIAAEFSAACFARDLQHRGLHALVSKYIGETEKNPGRIIDAAKPMGAVFFFDEADDLFGKRVEVWRDCDPCANPQADYLVQRIEHYKGAVVLATNLRWNLDFAFTHLMDVVFRFSLPDSEVRHKLS